MKQAKLEQLVKEHKTNEISWVGKCHDCKQDSVHFEIEE